MLEATAPRISLRDLGGLALRGLGHAASLRHDAFLGGSVIWLWCCEGQCAEYEFVIVRRSQLVVLSC